jgi:mRNA-degrading endonuclease toxin of MazEF toxin-antitoxin module
MVGGDAGRPRITVMERGDIYLVSLDPASGHEQKGRRPVLVVAPGRFNRLTKVPIVLPITSTGPFARFAGFAVSLTGTDTQTTGIIRCDQPRALDLGARGGQKLETVPDKIMEDVLSRLAPIFE